MLYYGKHAINHLLKKDECTVRELQEEAARLTQILFDELSHNHGSDSGGESGIDSGAIIELARKSGILRSFKPSQNIITPIRFYHN